MTTEKELELLLAERERLAVAIQDLEEDYRLGQVSKTDYELVRERYERKLREVERKLKAAEVEPRREIARRRTIPPPYPRKLKRERPMIFGLPSFGWTFLGLVGGILAAVSMFLPWLSIWYMNASGWDIVTAVGPEIMGCPRGAALFLAPILVMIGGFVALAGGIDMLIGRGMGFLLPIGGILALIGGVWGLTDVGGLAAIFGISTGYGIYVGIIGGILALIGTLSLMGGE
jgi:hypothetical protein